MHRRSRAGGSLQPGRRQKAEGTYADTRSQGATNRKQGFQESGQSLIWWLPSAFFNEYSMPQVAPFLDMVIVVTYIFGQVPSQPRTKAQG